MKRKELIEKYINFFKKKEHKVIPNKNLIPENDPTVLFITAGMQPLVPYLMGEKHPLGKRLVNIQRCLRTVDIDSIGDSYHHSFFEMFGNWSLGDYWKKESIEFIFEFFIKELKIPKEKIGITCFKGNENTKKDFESIKIWKNLGISEKRIFLLKNNWWGPAGKTGPCGPNTEIFYWKNKSEKPPEKFDPKDEKNWVELGNIVLMEYIKEIDGIKKSKQKNIDFGGGVERTIAILQGLEDNYSTEIWKPIINEIEKISGKKYSKNKKEMRIIADHMKAAVFIISDGICPKNTEQGYILRRLIRRTIRYGKILGIKNFTKKIAEKIFEIYTEYDNLKENKKIILKELGKEEEKFNQTIEKGMIKFEKISKNLKKISGKDAFLLYQSYGFPLEMTQELSKEKNIEINVNEFEKLKKEHQKISKISSEKKFKSGLADNSEKTKKLHTATHLLNSALKIILNDEKISQKGSNITSERLRFDFNFNRKLNGDELKKIEKLINEKIKKGLEIKKEEMDFEKTKDMGIESNFEKKYPEKVSIYTILDGSEKKGWFSKEICTGPHVKNTKEIGKIKIIKEESVSSGIRRIKAIIE